MRSLTDSHSGRRIHLQHANCRATDRRHADDPLPIPGEVLVPLIRSGIKKRSDRMRQGIDSSEITSLMQVALGTCQRQIVEAVIAAVFSGHDMLNLQRHKRRIKLQTLAILATIVCSTANRGASRRVDGHRASSVRRKRASACSTASRLFASM